MGNELKCPICGSPTRVYMGNARKDRLCGYHADLLKNGQIYLAEDGIYYDTVDDEDDECIPTYDIQCLLCGEDSEGKHFCRSCYRTYSAKSITVVLKNCRTAEVLDEYGNKQYKCDNGFYVRSTQEKIIADELFKRNIRCVYEQAVLYKKDDGTIGEIHPDFYLPDYDLYIEHWGFSQTDPKYLKTKRFKEQIFESQRKVVVGTTAEDIKNISTTIEKILLQYEDRNRMRSTVQVTQPQPNKQNTRRKKITDDESLGF